MPLSALLKSPRRLLRMLSAAAVLYWLALTIVMHIPLSPRPPEPDDGIPKDKTVHFVLYGGLAVALISVFEQRFRVDPTSRPRTKAGRCGAVTAFCAVHGIIEELTQPLTGRTFDQADFVADCLGASVALASFYVVGRVIATARKNQARV